MRPRFMQVITNQAAAAISATDIIAWGVLVQADQGNSGDVTVGDSTAQTFQVPTGPDYIGLPNVHLSQVYVKSTANGDKVNLIIYE